MTEKPIKKNTINNPKNNNNNNIVKKEIKIENKHILKVKNFFKKIKIKLVGFFKFLQKKNFFNNSTSFLLVFILFFTIISINNKKETVKEKPIIIKTTSDEFNEQFKIKKDFKINSEQFSFYQRIREFDKSHQYYTTIATKNELFTKWIELFDGWRYVLNGDPKYKKADCVGAVYHFLTNGWNSNMYLEDVKSIVGRAKILAKKSELKIRRSKYSIKSGDLIIIQVVKNKPSHAGIVYDVQNNWVRYFDLNIKHRTWGMRSVRWKDWRVYAIYEISLSFWLGDLCSQAREFYKLD